MEVAPSPSPLTLRDLTLRRDHHPSMEEATVFAASVPKAGGRKGSCEHT